MVANSNVKFTIRFEDPNLDEEGLDGEARRFLNELRDLDEVEAADRVLDPNPPEGNKALGGFLVGILSAEVSPTNIKALCRFLGDRLGGKPRVNAYVS
ncbi:hypothetical protein [Leptolyngbya sp. FACHB-16]|uniref:hypothetical protein n=1 Tax=unclassified Leptolyngbya TaxID=2650499 RepID=UPI001683399A|nr:hypothetical protein [Leptolyngbya sp. FACHB-16]MBD2156940.1 hypothetical protein [Leptolyngbya sp. FACHB-16]